MNVISDEDHEEWLDENDKAPKVDSDNKDGWNNYVDLESGGK